jgi:hypothetical protein
MPACSLLFIGTLLLVGGILLGVSAGYAGHQDHAFGVIVAATVIVSLLVLGACISGCRLWLEQPPIIDDRDAELGDVYGEYVAATVLTALAWVFIVVIGLYFCYETYR